MIYINVYIDEYIYIYTYTYIHIHISMVSLNLTRQRWRSRGPRCWAARRVRWRCWRPASSPIASGVNIRFDSYSN